MRHGVGPTEAYSCPLSEGILQRNTKSWSGGHFTDTLSGMSIPKFVMWQDQGKWRGHLQGYPDHQVQGEHFDELELKMRQLVREFVNGKLSNLRKIA